LQLDGPHVTNLNDVGIEEDLLRRSIQNLGTEHAVAGALLAELIHSPNACLDCVIDEGVLLEHRDGAVFCVSFGWLAADLKR
jgi:hypothetical protein